MRTWYCFLMSAIVLCAGCNIVGEQGSGVAASEDREVDDFHAVSLSGSGSLTVKVGQPKHVNVSIDDNLIDMVRTEVVNGELRVYTRGSYSTSLGLKVTVGVPALDSAQVSGSGDIDIENARGSSLDLSVSGSGTINAGGQVDKLKISVSGSGDARLKGLTAQSVTASVTGSGDAAVFATESVSAVVTGSGDIEIFGNATDVKQSTTGSGDIHIRN